jgi:phosphoenolpyruvate---glycerone phosphotransferase subunit DhaL
MGIEEGVDGDGVVRWIERAAELFNENKTYLTELDAAVGDSDHGVNMARGFNAVREKLAGQARGEVGAIFKTIGMTLLSTVGGASGPLYGTFFLDAAKAAGAAPRLDVSSVARCIRAGLEGVQRRGKAERGDKTMVDALLPAVEALDECERAGAPFAESTRRAALAAQMGAEGTAPLVARKGRASYLGERSAGHRDPGATSTWLLLRSLAETAAPS